MYRIKGDKLEKITETKLKTEGKLEGDLESWVENNPAILGEDLFLIGRQVPVSEVKDKIDLLALDVEGNSVIIELKRGRIKDPVDIQSLRYASYVSRWTYAKLEEQATNYYTERGETDFNFNERFEEFISQTGIEEVPELPNQDQRIIIMGSHISEKLGSVALWLRKHNIDIKIVEVSCYKDADSYFLIPQITIPPPSTEKFEIGRKSEIRDKPWAANGQEWHLDKRCGKIMKDKLIQLNDLISKSFEEVDGPYWNQKLYVSFKVEGHIWLSVHTHKTALILNFIVKASDMDVREISKNLGIKTFDKESTLSEKLQLESSVDITSKGEHDRVILRVKEDFDVSSEQFLKFMEDCLKSFKKSVDS